MVSFLSSIQVKARTLNEGYSLDQIKMTESWQRQTLLNEYDRNNDKDKHYLLNMTEMDTDKPN